MKKKYDDMLKKEIIARKIVSKDDAEIISKEALAGEDALIAMLVKNYSVPEKQLLDILSEKLGIPYLDLKTADIDERVISKVPIKLASYYRIMPISIEERTLTVASAYPLEVKTMDDLRMQIGYDIKQALSVSDDIEEATKRFYGLGAETLEKIMSKAPQAEEEKRKAAISEESIEDIEKIAGDVSIIRLVNQIILEA
ncbi:MAG: hypothetical protein KKG84_02370, partial [Candidatus Omnitrophica bacterium]|nr:hypothetical protein [Candidatus Omnitrophota bacterium]